MLTQRQLLIIGGGPAGLAAALEARRQGIEDILIVERDRELGGILNQCIHAGFGLHLFGREMTGPEYAAEFIRQVEEQKIEYTLDSMVLSVTPERVVTYVSPQTGLVSVSAGAVVLAMGCRERTRGALNIAGSRPAGIFSAGTAQRYVNMEGYLPGKRVVILGSGDIGLIMARRMTLEGAEVVCVCELMPYSSGLARNIAQCLDDFNIPLKFSHTVVDIKGKDRLEGVTIAAVGPDLKPIEGTQEYIECDTLLLSVGLIPENELSGELGIAMDRTTGGASVDSDMMTSCEGVFACGNVLHVHDLVDFVTQEAYHAGASAAQYIKQGHNKPTKMIRTTPKNGVRYIVPQALNPDTLKKGDRLFLRVDNIYRGASIVVKADGEVIKRTKRPKLAPGEMESIAIDEKLLKAITGASEITIELEKSAEQGR